MTTVNTFENLRNMYIAEREAQTANTLHYIRFGYKPTWSAEHRTDADRGIRDHATDHTLDQYKRGEIDRETAIIRAEKRHLKAEEKKRAEELARLDRIANAPDVAYFDISVEWKRSAAWGYNPTATAYIRTAENGRESYTGRASGYGYDKRSAAVAEALNQSDSVLKILYTAAENALEQGKRPRTKGFVSGSASWRDILGYGSGYGAFPYFEGGVGVSCFWRILERCGFWTHSNENGKDNDYYFVGKTESEDR